jgi:DNA invertase Pin-like site-specific DNA recombinase
MARKVTVIPANQTKGNNASAGNQRKTRVAAYCRVSTDHEEQEGSFKNQMTYYTDMIEGREDWELAGIFADDGISGTGTRKRAGFMDMIQACEEGRVDLVITKSISRFARNTADSLNFSRKLKALGIPIIFEKENVNTMEASGELMFTILSSLAQEESRNISENSAWGIRSKFQQGIPHLNCECLLGYDKDENGNLVINEEQAVTVRRIYRDFLEGWTVSEISRRLNEEGVPGVHGKATWYPISIERVLKNEKHVGDILMQKTFTSDFLTKTVRENNGQLEQYYIKDNHPGIVSREEWDAVQLELERRESFRQRHSIHTIGSSTDDPYYSRVFCAACGGKLVRKAWKRMREPFWKCENAEKKKGHTCEAENVMEATLKKAVVIAWNSLVERRDEHLPHWQRMAAEGTALDRYRARLMIAVTADGPLEAEVPELTRMMLEEILVHTPTDLTVSFLDGSTIRVQV